MEEVTTNPPTVTSLIGRYAGGDYRVMKVLGGRCQRKGSPEHLEDTATGRFPEKWILNRWMRLLAGFPENDVDAAAGRFPVEMTSRRRGVLCVPRSWRR